MGTAALVDQPSESNAVLAPVVRVQNLAKRYKKTVAVRDVSLSVRPGEVYGLIGPDGSGKSSLIRAIAGVQQYDSGSVHVFGQLVNSEQSAERVKGRLGLMPQGLGNNLYRDLSIDENIDYFAGLRLIDKDVVRQRKDLLLSMTRLIDFRDRPMKLLSGGMKQKLGLVCTLIHEPSLVLLDEPTTGVDPVSRRDFWAILAQLVHDSGMSVIVSTAYMDEAAYMDRIALMMDGEIVSQGKVEQIESLVSGQVLSITTPDAFSIADEVRQRFPAVETMGNVVRLFVSDGEIDEATRLLSATTGYQPDAVERTNPELEDVLASVLLSKSASDGSKTLSLEAEAIKNGKVPPRGRLAIRHSKPGDKGINAPIEARELVQDFGNFRAVDHVSFDVAEGEIFGLLGANGAGKTTVIKMLTGLLPPTAGHGNVAGADMTKGGHSIKERIGYMSQSFSLYTDLRAIENLEFYAGVYGLFPRARRKRIPEILRMIGLEGLERRMTGDLPMGIRQRLALGCALVHRPRVVFLDEPTSGVDVLGRRQFWNILVRLAREEGVAILVTTHYMSEAEHCDDLALMYAGRVITAGAPAKLRRELEVDVGIPLGIVTNNPLRTLQIAKNNGFEKSALFGKSLRLLSKDPESDEQRLRCLLEEQQVQVIDVHQESATMEDVFVNTVLAQEDAHT